ncbi:ROK family transcriptional regulator [Nocardioides fonticola]|uniref:ROK family transcriptional regulator n=1 Tax=Nocardioides fonticola TaxID=450363 RepID=A0ABP7XQT7_9ACTN
MTGRRPGQGTNQEAVRRHNLGTLLRHVHGAGSISRSELTTAMGLNRSTIADLVGQLEALGVTEQGRPVGGARPKAGRPSPSVAVAADGPYVVAVDLGVDRAVVARVGLGGRLHERAEAPIPLEEAEAWQVGGIVAGLVRQVVAAAPDTAPLVGLGISVPGLVRRTDGLVRLAPNLDWHDVSFAGIVLAALGLEVPVRLGNDADLGALAEHRRGAGMGIDDLIFLSGNCGVGAGVIAHGHRLEGAGGYAGEVGHISFDPRGLDCHCGSKGCWETEVGGYAIARAIGLPQREVPQLATALAQWEERTPELSAIARSLGLGLSTIVNIFNPELIVLGGYFSALYSLCADDVHAGLGERSLTASFDAVTLSVPGLGQDSVLLGAAEIAFEALFADPEAALGAAVVDAHGQLAV